MRHDTGDATAEVVVLTPVLILLVMLCVQVAAWSHAATVATSVAARVAHVQARHGASAGDGERVGAELLSALDRTSAAAVTVEHGMSEVRAEVALGVPAIVPGLPAEVRRQVVIVRERVLSEVQR